jgi:integrase
LATNQRSKAYINGIIKRLKTFFRVNGFTGLTELVVRTYFVPARYRKVPEHIPTKPEVLAMANAAGSQRDRAIILALWTTGLRVSTLCALNYGDIVEELTSGEPPVIVPVSPAMKTRVPDACKGGVPYYTFLSSEAGAALRYYLRIREEDYGPIDANDPLFFSNWTLWTRKERSHKRLGRRGVGLIVKKSARLAGLQAWQHVTPHCLRKAFESVLRSPTIDGGRLDKGSQEFLFGHILPGSQDVYYDKKDVAYHREEYAKLNFSSGIPTRRVVDKLIDRKALEDHLKQGWIFVAKLNESELIIRRVT